MSVSATKKKKSHDHAWLWGKTPGVNALWGAARWAEESLSALWFSVWATWQDTVNPLSGREGQGWEGNCCNKHQYLISRNLPRCKKLALHLTELLIVLQISWKCCFEPRSSVNVQQVRSEHTLLDHLIPKLPKLIFLSAVTLLLTGFLSYQWLGFLLIFVIVQPIPSQNKPATVPRFDESPLLPEPPTPGDTRASVHLALTSAVLGAVVGRALLVHHGSSDLRKQAKLVGNPVMKRCCCYLNFHYLSN